MPNHTLSLSLDDDDFRDVMAAIQRRKTFQIHGSVILPDSKSNEVGCVLAEICRGWQEALDLADNTTGGS